MPGGAFGRPFNAILDTGSTRTLIPRDLSKLNGILESDVTRELSAVGGSARGFEAAAEIAIVDAHYPEINCWEIADTRPVIMRDEDLETPVLGWDILELFEFSVDRRRQRISMRLHTA